MVAIIVAATGHAALVDHDGDPSTSSQQDTELVEGGQLYIFTDGGLPEWRRCARARSRAPRRAQVGSTGPDFQLRPTAWV